MKSVSTPKAARATSAAHATTKTTQSAGEKPSARAKAASPSSSDSMTAIREDRITKVAFYALFGAMLAGMLYFIALVFLI